MSVAGVLSILIGWLAAGASVLYGIAIRVYYPDLALNVAIAGIITGILFITFGSIANSVKRSADAAQKHAEHLQVIAQNSYETVRILNWMAQRRGQQRPSSTPNP